MAGASLELRELSKHYGGSGAVLGVSLSLEPGHFLTLLGPSGSGKTTTLMMIAGFAEPSAGEILINGRSVTRTPPHARDIDMVFQNYALFPHLTVAENIGFPLKMRKTPKAEARDRVASFARLVGLEAMTGRYPNQLSGGQQQRVALARALVFSPSLVLMDEPLGALDRRLRLQLQEEIKSLQQKLGLTVVYVTHDQEEALTMSDRIAVMEGGRVSSIGSPREIYEAPSNRFVAGFVGESNFIPCRLERFGSERLAARVGPEHLVEVGRAHAGPDEKAVIFIRPERLRLCTGEDALRNKLPGRILGEIYLGDASLFRVRLGDGTEVRVKRPNRGLGIPAAVGDDLLVGWKTDDSLVLRA